MRGNVAKEVAGLSDGDPAQCPAGSPVGGLG